MKNIIKEELIYFVFSFVKIVGIIIFIICRVALRALLIVDFIAYNNMICSLLYSRSWQQGDIVDNGNLQNFLTRELLEHVFVKFSLAFP